MKSRIADAGDPSSVRWSVFVGDIDLDYCSACRGIWFDGGELAELLAHDTKDVLEKSVRSATFRKCPKCGKKTRPGDLSCHYCAASLLASCPRCKKPIDEWVVDGFDGITAPFCASCKGVWLEEKLVLAIADALKEKKAPEPEEPPDSQPPQPGPIPQEADGESEPNKERDSLTCAWCQKSGLTLETSMMSEDGPICEDCALKSEEDDRIGFTRMEGNDALDLLVRRMEDEKIDDGIEPEWRPTTFMEDLNNAYYELLSILNDNRKFWS